VSQLLISGSAVGLEVNEQAPVAGTTRELNREQILLAAVDAIKHLSESISAALAPHASNVIRCWSTTVALIAKKNASNGPEQVIVR
jgi:hypothetical protein